MRSRVALAAFGAALLLALTCVFAMPAHAANIEKTQTQLGYQSYPITLAKGAVKLDMAAGATVSDVGIFTGVDASGYGTGQIAHAYANDPYATASKYGNVAKSGTYYLVFYTSKYNGATGTKATVTQYPLSTKSKPSTATVGKAFEGTSCGDSTTVAYYKLKVAKRGHLTIQLKDMTGYDYSASIRLCSAKKKPFTSNESWTYVQNGAKANFGVKKGTYFLAVKSGGSVYKLTPKLTACTKAGGTKKSKAATVKLGKVAKGVLAAGENERWYKIEVTKAKKYTIALTGKTDRTGLKVIFSGDGYWDANAYVYSTSQEKTTVKTNKLKAGTYYMKVVPFRTSGNGGNGYFTIKWK